MFGFLSRRKRHSPSTSHASAGMQNKFSLTSADQVLEIASRHAVAKRVKNGGNLEFHLTLSATHGIELHELADDIRRKARSHGLLFSGLTNGNQTIRFQRIG